MALNHEKLVEEWYRRNRHFTIRSAKIGLNEIDLLALTEEFQERGQNVSYKLVKKHIEIQISFKPVGYITSSNAKNKSREDLKESVEKWVWKKFISDAAQDIRSAFNYETGDIKDWKFEFVHHKVRDPYELDLIANNKYQKIKLIKFDDIIKELRRDDGFGTARRGSDAADQVSLIKMK